MPALNYTGTQQLYLPVVFAGVLVAIWKRQIGLHRGIRRIGNIQRRAGVGFCEFQASFFHLTETDLFLASDILLLLLFSLELTSIEMFK